MKILGIVMITLAAFLMGFSCATVQSNGAPVEPEWVFEGNPPPPYGWMDFPPESITSLTTALGSLML